MSNPYATTYFRCSTCGALKMVNNLWGDVESHRICRIAGCEASADEISVEDFIVYGRKLVAEQDEKFDRLSNHLNHLSKIIPSVPDDVETWYLATCLRCTPFISMPFRSHTERTRWAGEHSRLTGHPVTIEQETRRVGEPIEPVRWHDNHLDPKYRIKDRNIIDVLGTDV